MSDNVAIAEKSQSTYLESNIKPYKHGLKKCVKCGKVLPATTEYFYKKKSKAKYPKYKYYLRNKCKKCCDEETIKAMHKYRKKMEEKSQDVVYFVLCEETKAIKIGFSKNIQRRMKDLKVATPGTLRLIGVIPGDIQLERRIQKNFRKYWIRGEWFKASKEIKKFIKEFAVSDSNA